jgi:4-hydroxybenzoate polyprenyltransferase
LSPEIVTVPEPEAAVFFTLTSVVTGASYVKAKPNRVPTIAPTVTFTYLCFALVVAAVRHAKVVSDVHDDEEHPK